MRRFMCSWVVALLTVSTAVADGTEELGQYQLLRAGTQLYADLVDPAVERIAWNGTGQVRVTAPDGSDLGTFDSGSVISGVPGAAGAYGVEVLAAQVSSVAWDVSVVDPVVPGGRIWSRNWRFNAGSFAASRSTFASFYAVVPAGNLGDTSVIELQVDGLSGYVYDLNANGEGVQGENGGRSVPAAGNSALPDYAIYLHPPTNASYTRSEPAADGFWLNGGGQQSVVNDSLTECDDIWSGHSGLAFYFETDVTGTYHIVCDLDGDGFERTSGDDVFLVGTTEPGWNTVPWSGYAPDGSVIPEGDYDCQLAINVGEFHYVGYDIETAYQGLRLYEVDAVGARTPLPMFWDDGLVQSNAQSMLNGDVGLIRSGEGGVLPGPYGSTAVANGDARSWGAFNSGGKGNQAYLDTYTWLGSTAGATISFHSADGLVDSDGDGISDYEERCWCGTDPQSDATRGDGESDAEVCSSGVSSGQDGGLESNGRLQSALAHRAMRSTRGVRRAVPVTGDSTYAPWIPQMGPSRSVPVDVTPHDLVTYTNADAVSAWDYIDAYGERIGAVMVIETTGALYEHSKAVCDRAGGATLTSVGGMSVGGGEVLRASFLSEATQRDHSATWMLFEQPDQAWEDGVRSGGWTAASGWLLSDYPEPEPEQRVVEVQVWGASPSIAEALTRDILSGVESSQPVRWTHGGDAPQAFITEASTHAGRLDLRLRHGQDADLSVTTTLTLQDGREQVVELPVVAQDDRGTVSAQLPLFSDAMVDVWVDDQVVDKVWLSDGVWVPFHDGLFGGASQHTAFSNTDCVVGEEGRADAAETLGADLAEARQWSGCGRIDARVDDFGGVARHIAGLPLDITQAGSMVFWAESSVPLTVCVESAQTHTSACAGVDAADGWTAIPVSQLQWSGLDEHDPRTSVSFISFVVSDTERAEMTVSSLFIAPWVPSSEDAVSDEQPAVACGCSTQATGVSTSWLFGFIIVLAAPLTRRRTT